MATRLSQKERERLKSDHAQYASLSNPDFFKEFFHVDHRDLPGEIVPFDCNFGQRKLDQYLHDCARFNLRMQIDGARQGQRSYIPNLLERVDTGQEIQDHEIGLECLVGKSRRGGFSTHIEHIGLRRVSWLGKYEVLVMAHDQATAKTVNEMARLSYDFWPAKHETLKLSIRAQNDEEFSLANRSKFSVRTAGQKKQANEKTRGWKFDFYHFSEYAHFFTYADAQQTRLVARPHAWIIKESTANGKTGPFYNEWQGAAYLHEVIAAYEAKDVDFFKSWNGQYKFFFSWLEDPGLTTQIYDWEKEELTASLTPYELELMKKHPDLCTLDRIKFRRETIRNRCQDHERLEPEALYMQEYPADEDEMFQSTSLAIFDADSLEILMKQAKRFVPLVSARVFADQPPKQSWLGGSNFWMYDLPKEGHSYVIGGDIGYGIGKDDSVAVVLDRLDGTVLREVACLKSNTIDPKSFGHIMTMMAEMYNDAFINCEVMGPGHTTNQAIIEDNRYGWLYHRKTLDLIMVDGNTSSNFRYGFFTSEQGKHAIVGDTRPVIKDRTIILASPWGVKQLQDFEEDDKGKLGKEGVRDDYVLALCLAVWASFRAAPGLETAIRRAAKKKVRQAKLSVDDEAWWKTIMRQIDGNIAKNRQIGRSGGLYLPSVDEVFRPGYDADHE